MKFMISYDPNENHYYMVQYEVLEKGTNPEIKRPYHYIDGIRLLAIKDSTVPIDEIVSKPPMHIKGGLIISISEDEKLFGDNSEFELLEFDTYDEAFLYYLTKFNFGG